MILAEALRLFAEHGYGGSSIRDIAKLVGIKGASLYSHYPSKAHLLAELIRIGHDEHLQRIRAAMLGAGADPKLQLAALVRAHVLAHAEYPMLAVVANSEMHALPAEFAAPILEVRRQSESLLLDIINRGIALGKFAVAEPSLAVTAIGAMGLRVAHWYSPEISKTPTQIADAYVEFACRVVGAKK
ncbi:MAG TPA: TetR/AcrR family transcriptional regulator [Nevskiaceae bacterium]|nr:TetR/AcrR family transcriptional regulator [Nevskiaceae bacterium]